MILKPALEKTALLTPNLFLFLWIPPNCHPLIFNSFKRKLVKSFFILLPVMLLTGCATLGVKDEALDLQINPQPLLRGQAASAQVNAPMNAEKVIGTVKVFGSPKLIFAKSEERGIWYFYGKIPFSPWVKPGDYQVQVLVYLPHEQPHYTEMRVELK